jgi:hypothetical protein
MANENPFSVSKQSLVIKPKTIAKQAFNYKGIADLENLIGFVGTAPKVNMEAGKMVLSFGKQTIKDGSIVLRNSFGQVTDVLAYSQAAELYDIAAERDFKAEDKNKVTDKPVKKAK